jgi:large subunit ribosomal protein L21
MYAVVATGGKQYRVEAGSELIVERLTAEPGAPITFDRILLVGDGEAVTVGTPTVDGASVSGTVIGEELGPKLIVFKFKQKVKYRRTNGHRQHLTRVRIDEISAGGKRSKAEAAKEPARATAKTAATEAAGDASAAAETPAKPARTRRAASPKKQTAAAPEADATEAPTAKPAARRRTAKKAEAEE